MLGRYVKVYDCGGGYMTVELDEEPRIDAAVEAWISSGKQRDTLLSLTLVDGDQYKVLASTITSWLISSPAGRTASLEWEKAATEERTELRRTVGLWDEE